MNKQAAFSLLFSVPAALSAVEIGNVAGPWSLAQFSSPTRLRETYQNSDTGAIYITVNSQDPNVPEGMELVDAFYSDPVRAQTKDFAISAGGAVTGDETGTAISLSKNRLLYRGADVLTTIFANPAGDILVESKREEDNQDLNIALKKPEQLALADLAGSWNLVSIITPDDLTKVGSLDDVYFIGNSQVLTGAIEVSGNGTFTGLFSGTIALDDTVVLVSTPLGSASFRINRGKNLMIATLQQDDEAEIILLVRKPDSLTTGDLAGSWRFNNMTVPTTLTETYFNVQTSEVRQVDSSEFGGPNEVLVDLFHEDSFNLERGNLQVAENGAVSGSFVTSVAAGPNETVEITANGETFPFFINADRSALIGAVADGGSQQLIVVLKTDEEAPGSREEAFDLTPVAAGDKLYLSWAGESGTKLEVATEGGAWGGLDSSEAQDAIEVDFSAAPRAIFRLVEEVPATEE